MRFLLRVPQASEGQGGNNMVICSSNCPKLLTVLGAVLLKVLSQAQQHQRQLQGKFSGLSPDLSQTLGWDPHSLLQQDASDSELLARALGAEKVHPGKLTEKAPFPENTAAQSQRARPGGGCRVCRLPPPPPRPPQRPTLPFGTSCVCTCT